MPRQVSGVSATLDKLNKDFKREAAKEAQKVKKRLFENIKKGNPVDTGWSVAGWYMTKTSIENDVDYVSTLEHGTSKRAGLFFIRKAVMREPKVRPSGIIVRNK